MQRGKHIDGEPVGKLAFIEFDDPSVVSRRLFSAFGKVRSAGADKSPMP